MQKFSPTIIIDSNQIEFLVNPKTQRYFMPFLDSEKTSSQAARESQTSAQNMHYHIKKMLKVGLIRELINGKYTSSERAYSFRYRQDDSTAKHESVKLQILHQINLMEDGLENLAQKKHQYVHYIYRDSSGVAIISNRSPQDLQNPDYSADGFAKGGSILLSDDLAREFEERVEDLLRDLLMKAEKIKTSHDKNDYLYNLILVRK